MAYHLLINRALGNTWLRSVCCPNNRRACECYGNHVSRQKPEPSPPGGCLCCLILIADDTMGTNGDRWTLIEEPFWMCAYLYLGAQVCRYICVCMHAQAGGQPWVSFLRTCLLCLLGQGVSLTCGSPKLACQ